MMVIATINRTALVLDGAIVRGEYLLRWLPMGTYRWLKFPKPREVALLTRQASTMAEQIGVRINPVTRTFGISGFTGINYMLTACKPDHSDATQQWRGLSRFDRDRLTATATTLAEQRRNTQAG